MTKCKNCGHDIIKYHQTWMHITPELDGYYIGLDCGWEGEECDCIYPKPKTISKKAKP